MTSDSRHDGEYGREVLAILADAVRDELAIASGMDNLDLPDDVLDRMAQAVTSRIDYAFRLSWDPAWIAQGAPHAWSEDDRFFARCNSCLAVSPPMPTAESAREWHLTHQRATRHVG